MNVGRLPFESWKAFREVDDVLAAAACNLERETRSGQPFFEDVSNRLPIP